MHRPGHRTTLYDPAPRSRFNAFEESFTTGDYLPLDSFLDFSRDVLPGVPLRIRLAPANPTRSVACFGRSPRSLQRSTGLREAAAIHGQLTNCSIRSVTPNLRGELSQFTSMSCPRAGPVGKWFRSMWKNGSTFIPSGPMWTNRTQNRPA